jgi:hypothetical protein
VVAREVRERDMNRNVGPGAALLVIGLWLGAQVLLGQLVDRLQAWQGYFAEGSSRTSRSAT